MNIRPVASLTSRWLATHWVSFACMMLLAWPSLCLASPPEKSLETVEVRYDVSGAGAVELVWGVDGWQPVKEGVRPQGTQLHFGIMSTPMVRSNGVFTVTIQIEVGTTLDYQFLITKTAGAAPVEIWDKNDSYHLTVTSSQVLHVQSKRLHPFYGLLADRPGITFIILLAIFFAGSAIVFAFWPKEPATHTDASRRHPPDTRFAITLSILAGALGLLVIINHELWRDELQAWRIATSSASIDELFSNSRYEGHPAIWYLSLYLISRLSDNPIAMQVLHILIGISATFVMCKYAPFSRWQKASLSFGYFMFFEYFIVSRNYAFGVLALWGFCALRAHGHRIFVSTAVLGFLANTSAFGAILAISLGAGLLVETFSKGQEVSALNKLGLVSMLAFAILLANLQSAPLPDNSPRILTWNTSILGSSLEKTLASVWKAYMPLPSNILHFWNTNLLDDLPPVNVGILILESRDIEAMLSLLLIGLSMFVLLPTPTLLLAYILGTSTLLFFLHTKVNHGIRHPGHLFLLLVACLWLSHNRKGINLRSFPKKLPATFMAIVFLMQLIAGILCASTDLVYPFTASKAAAQFIEEQQFTNTMLVGSNWNLVSGVACYLNRPVYYVENGHTGTFSAWNIKRSKLSPAEVIDKASRLRQDTHRDVLLILSYDPGNSAAGLQKLASFERSVLKEERYWLYLLPATSERQAS